MQIIEKIKVDRTGRLLLAKVFKEPPKELVILFDAKSKKLFFREATNTNEQKIARKVDSKNRISLPRWVIEELGTEYYVFVESLDKHYVMPSKFLFVG